MERVLITGIGTLSPMGLDAASTWQALLDGSAIGGIGIIEQQQRVLMEKGPGRVSSTFLPNALVDTATSYIATKFGAIGRNFAVISACATGSHAIGEAADLIKRGSADAMIAGGTEACITPLVLAGFCQMQALAARNDDPAAASRPFDRGRSGFVASNDAYHVATPHPGSRGVIRMFQDALEDARVRPEEVGYINTHGTGTPLGDPAETQAIRQAFGAHADSLATSSTKSMTGHLFGAAGALEAIITALALRDQVLPPTINLEDPDPECDLDYVPLKSREARFDVAISNSMGLGGHNGAVVLRRVVP